MQKDKLIKMLKLWLKKNEADTDLLFYTIEEWNKKGETYHNDAEFVITTEGGLHSILNYGDPEEFYDLIDSFGYYCEMGHSWNIGFYKEEIEDPNINKEKTYSQKLKDVRWLNKRQFILKRALHRCEDCSSSHNLEIHHCYYIFNCEPWEYPYDALRCLCRICHEKRGLTEHILRGNLASLKTNELISLIDLISNGLYWYPSDEMFSFLESFHHDQEQTKTKFLDLLTKRVNNRH